MAEVVELLSDEETGEDTPGPTRKEMKPSVCEMEAAWFNIKYPVPDDQVKDSVIPKECVETFQDLIWNRPHDRMVHGYGMTPRELACVSAEGRRGWLVTSHFYWLSQCINSQQEHSRFYVLEPSIRKGSIEKLLVKKANAKIKQLVFVLSVGRHDDGKVFLGTDKEPGDHWSMAVVDIHMGVLTYCDTLGWPLPTKLLSAVVRYTSFLHLTEVSQFTVRLAHEPSPDEQHSCTDKCTNYPLQTCSDVCGVIAMICAAVASLDKELFETLLHTGRLNLYLTDPTQYSTYLRHVVLYWLASQKIDITRISLKRSFDPFAIPAVPSMSRPANAKNSYEDNVDGEISRSHGFKRKIDGEVNGIGKAGSSTPAKKRAAYENLSKTKDINRFILNAVDSGLSSEEIVVGVTECFGAQAKSSLERLNEEMVECYEDILFNDAIERFKDDGLSTKSYVRELIDYPFANPIMIFKSQGKELKTLSKEDIVLAVQTPYQKDMMKTYGPKCVCVDLTRKRDGDSFYLFTILVFVEGMAEVPVAWLLSNRSDNIVQSLFFKTLKLNIGPLQTEIFVGDAASIFYKNWISHFPRPTKRMFCIWEVYNMLSSRLNTFITQVEARNKVKLQLSVIALITDAEACDTYISALMDVLKPHEDFREYFKDRFVDENKLLFWAPCYRVIPSSKFIPFLRPFSRTLEHLGLYAGGGKDQILARSDILLLKLLQMSRHLEDCLLTQSSEARLSRAKKSMNLRHRGVNNSGNGSQAAPSLCSDSDFDIYTSASGDSWLVRASANTNSYSVIHTGKSEDCGCGIHCEVCRICVHQYACSCPDYLLNAGGCFHLHAVRSFCKINERIGGPASSLSKSS